MFLGDVLAMRSEVEKVTAEGGRPGWVPDRPLLLTQEQVAALLNICPRMVRNLIRARKLIPKFIGRRCLIPAAQVEKFARQVAGQ